MNPIKSILKVLLLDGNQKYRLDIYLAIIRIEFQFVQTLWRRSTKSIKNKIRVIKNLSSCFNKSKNELDVINSQLKINKTTNNFNN